MPHVSILMSTFNQAAFIRRALESLWAQVFDDWELVVVDDGSTDATPTMLQTYLDDARVRHQRFERNVGLGAALNAALELAQGEFVAYLPSDDVFYPEHLATLVATLEQHPEAMLAFAGVRYHYNRFAEGQVEGYPLQLAQVMHRRTNDRWVERGELVTDDLERMFWAKLRAHGRFVGTRQVTCEWVNHPDQRHKVIHEDRGGGINPYRVRYNVQKPLRFQSSIGNAIDEIAQYQRFRDRPDIPMALDGLKILLVGELAYNAERVLALREHGHKLYGLWTPDPMWFNTVGPLPFGHVEDLPRVGWQNALKHVKPDVIYALLNWQTVPFVHQVLQENPGVPFVWHFKEGPFICIEKGMWNQLLDLYTRSDGRIYSSPEMRDWFFTVAPELRDMGGLVLDGDLPKRDWFDVPRAPLLSQRDGELHTVVPGRPIGLHPWTVGELAQQGIHLHFYGDFTQGIWRTWIEKANVVAQGYLHLHPNAPQDRWVEEFSQYDAGWLHFFESENRGDVRRANWDDLNYPARIATLAVSGLPMLQRDNTGAIVASQTLARQHDLGLFFSDMAGLRVQLSNQELMTRIRESVWRQREQFMFDTHVEALVAYFRQVIG